jgi:hypothetical protein
LWFQQLVQELVLESESVQELVLESELAPVPVPEQPRKV